MKLGPCLFLVGLAFLSSCSPKAPDPQSGAACPSGLDPADFENHSSLRLDEDWIVGASSKWIKAASNGPAEPVSELHALHRENGKWKEVFRRELPSSYNARVSVVRNVRRDVPLVFFLSQQGAALETLSVYTVDSGAYKLIQSLEAGGFEWSFDEKRGLSALVAIPWENGEKPVLYTWDGQRFSEAAKP